jgi:segregation and condensation protein B
MMNDERADDVTREEPLNDTCDNSDTEVNANVDLPEGTENVSPEAPDSLVSVVEAVLFVNEKPMSVGDIASALGFERAAVEDAIKTLKESYEARNAGVCLIKVAGGWQMRTAEHCVEWVKTLYRDKFKRKLSNSALEVLAIIAYQQPITKMELEAIRGVDCDGVLRTLMNMDLVKLRGRKDVVGKPFLYGTTQGFLEHFGLNSLNDLPSIQDVAQIGEELRKMSGQDDGLSDDSEQPEDSDSPELSESAESRDVLDESDASGDEFVEEDEEDEDDDDE